MNKCISVLGSTGSIGRQTLDVAEACGFSVAAITVNSSVELAEGQVKSFKEGDDEANHKCGDGGQYKYRPPFFCCFDHKQVLLYFFSLCV